MEKRRILLIMGLMLVVMPAVFALSSSTKTIFSVEFIKPYCDYFSEPIGWWENNNGLYYFSAYGSEGYNCFRGDVEYGTRECCPNGLSCNAGTGTCEVGGETYCSDFTTEEDCEVDSGHSNIASAELAGLQDCSYESQYGDLCDQKINCLCTWDGTSCVASSNNIIIKDTDTYSFPFSNDIQTICKSQELPVGGVCKFKTEFIDQCESLNRKVVSWTAVWTGTEPAPSNCQSGKKTVPCISGALLGFFDTINFLVAILIIIALYILIARRRKKHSGKKLYKHK